ncbi:hypothetical protein C0991_006606 [Blastosporella zonata]|nr:hypothetical protein C0991_006606 [Blastosporella zonata]
MSLNLQRSTSPISFARRSQTPSRAHDISRLLDPAYASSNAYASTSAYVDRHGELHDPDYRHFPIVPQQPKRRASNVTVAARPRWETFDEEEDDNEHHNQFHLQQRTSFSSYKPRPSYTYTPSYVPAAPHSYDSQDTALDDDEADEYTEHDGDAFPRCGVSQFISRTKREFSRKRRSLDGRSTDSTPSPYYTPNLIPDTPSTACDDLEPHISGSLTRTISRHSHHSEPSYPTTTFTPLYSTTTRRSNKRHSAPSSTSSHHSASPQHNNSRSASPTPAHTYADHEQWTPTCAQALRRQWQAVSLSIRFGVFRAQRKVRSRLAGLS